MARYIDADGAIQTLRGACVAKYPASFYYGIFVSADEIDKMPTADVVEVVRCKDCVHYKADTEYCQTKHKGYCEYDGVIKLQKHFCSYGERKDT